jgi:hypothetical protein
LYQHERFETHKPPVFSFKGDIGLKAAGRKPGRVGHKRAKDHKEDQFEFLFLRSLCSFAAKCLFLGRDA